MSSEDKSIQELMELAKKPLKKVKELLVQYDDVHKFALMYKLKSSESNYAPTYLIFEMYAKWCQDNNCDLYSRVQFFKIFNSMFERYKKNGETCYRVNGQGLDVASYTVSEKQILRSIYMKRISEHVQTKKRSERSKKIFRDNKGEGEI